MINEKEFKLLLRFYKKNRVIKFRAKRIDNDIWVYGYYYEFKNIFGKVGYIISTSINSCIEVKPETCGQYTGFKDKYKIEIYEDDIVENMTMFDTCIVKKINGIYYLANNYYLDDKTAKNIIVKGNIFDIKNSFKKEKNK